MIACLCIPRTALIYRNFHFNSKQMVQFKWPRGKILIGKEIERLQYLKEKRIGDSNANHTGTNNGDFMATVSDWLRKLA